MPVLEKYFNLEIGLKEAKEELGLATKTKSAWYKLASRYRIENDIPKDFRNNVDLLASQGKRITSYIATKESQIATILANLE